VAKANFSDEPKVGLQLAAAAWMLIDKPSEQVVTHQRFDWKHRLLLPAMEATTKGDQSRSVIVLAKTKFVDRQHPTFH
jgi:hypothetical protein